MKKTMISAAIAVILASAGNSLFAQEYGANDYTGFDANQNTAVAATVDSQSEAEADSNVKCLWGWRYYNCYYYQPTYYYYTPCVYYRPCVSVYRYRYSVVCFHKSVDFKSATNDFGALIDETPKQGTPLAAQGIVKGDVITHIDGKKITDPKQLDGITARSNLVVIKANPGKNPVDAVAPNAPQVEYGAYEY